MLINADFKIFYVCACTLLVLGCLFITDSAHAHLLENGDASFAEEYKELRLLLQSVTNTQAAITFRPAIQEQISKLKQNQAAGEQAFSAMSKSEQELFVKKFQNNRYHCGEVTQVMEERQRILLHPDLSVILRDLLDQIP